MQRKGELFATHIQKCANIPKILRSRIKQKLNLYKKGRHLMKDDRMALMYRK